MLAMCMKRVQELCHIARTMHARCAHVAPRFTQDESESEEEEREREVNERVDRHGGGNTLLALPMNEHCPLE